MSVDVTLDRMHLTPLHCAVAAGDKFIDEDRRLRLVTYLVEEKGANINLQEAQGRTAAEMAKERNRLQVYRYLIKKAVEQKQAAGASREAAKGLLSSLLFEAEEGNWSGIQSIIQEVHEASSDFWEGSEGRYILHFVAYHAASRGFGYIVHFLISMHGVPIHRPSPAPRESLLREVEEMDEHVRLGTPLAVAMLFDQEDLALELLELLVPAGQTLDWLWRLGNGHTILHIMGWPVSCSCCCNAAWTFKRQSRHLTAMI
jgi:ankyrin repeat protein